MTNQNISQGGHTIVKKWSKGIGKTVQEKFWSRVAITADDSRCWNWLGSTDDNGYANVKIRGKSKGAHRISWEWANGRPPQEGMDILHSCDNRKCVNPNHLREGTAFDNVMDMVMRGRHPFALDIESVKQIKRLQAQGLRQCEVIKITGHSRKRVGSIFRNERFQWVIDIAGQER